MERIIFLNRAFQFFLEHPTEGKYLDSETSEQITKSSLIKEVDTLFGIEGKSEEEIFSDPWVRSKLAESASKMERTIPVNLKELVENYEKIEEMRVRAPQEAREEVEALIKREQEFHTKNVVSSEEISPPIRPVSVYLEPEKGQLLTTEKLTDKSVEQIADIATTARKYYSEYATDPKEAKNAYVSSVLGRKDVQTALGRDMSKPGPSTKSAVLAGLPMNVALQKNFKLGLGRIFDSALGFDPRKPWEAHAKIASGVGREEAILGREALDKLGIFEKATVDILVPHPKDVDNIIFKSVSSSAVSLPSMMGFVPARFVIRTVASETAKEGNEEEAVALHFKSYGIGGQNLFLIKQQFGHEMSPKRWREIERIFLKYDQKYRGLGNPLELDRALAKKGVRQNLRSQFANINKVGVNYSEGIQPGLGMFARMGGQIFGKQAKRWLGKQAGKLIGKEVIKKGLSGLAAKGAELAVIGESGLLTGGVGWVVGAVVMVAQEIWGWIRNSLKKINGETLLKAGLMVGVLGAFVGSPFLIGAGALGMVGGVGMMGTGGVGAAVTSGASLLGQGTMAILLMSGEAVAKPIVGGVVGTVLFVAFAMLIINNSAFVVPPESLQGSSSRARLTTSEACPEGWPFRLSESTPSAQGPYTTDSHAGAEALDVSVGSGTEIYATHPGAASVFYAHKIFGNHIQVQSVCEVDRVKYTFFSRYAHLSAISVTAGGVTDGELIGYSGDTGQSTGAHLHYEFKYTDGSTSWASGGTLSYFLNNPPYLALPFLPQDITRGCLWNCPNILP